MATCNGQPMGIGLLGSDEIVFKRKFRWTMLIEPRCNKGRIPENFVKLASRPNITIEETEINFLNGKTWIPGKGTWETITVTYYDVVKPNGSSIEGLYGWLASVYNFTDPVCLSQGSSRRDYGATATLTLYDGCGKGMEQWIMKDAWPQAVNFGDLDYSSSEEVTVEITLRYSNVEYRPLCGVKVPDPCCTGC